MPHTEYKHAFEDTNVINNFINDLYTTEKTIINECREKLILIRGNNFAAQV